MNRMIAMILALVLTLPLCACGAGSAQSGEVPAADKSESIVAKNEEATNEVYAEDFFAVEEIAYKYDRGKVSNFEVKIRNITDKKILDLYYGVQALDAAGDVIESWNMGSQDVLQPGQACWYYCSNNLFDDCGSIEEAATRAESVRIVFAKIQTVKDDPSSWVQYDFKDPPTARIADLPMRGKNMDEIIAPTEATVPTGPRVIGPEVVKAEALTIENVSVEFMDKLPGSFTRTTAYTASGNKEDFVLNESQSYAAVNFTVTNQTSKEIKLSDLNDDFKLELIYDGSFTYTSASDIPSFFLAGSQSAVVYDMSSIGKVSISPLVTMDMTIFLICSKQVEENTDKILDVVFTSDYNGLETYRFAIR